MKPPIIICGCPGSGTSLVTKMFRFAGLFVGADAGPPEVRLNHESECFRKCNESLLQLSIQVPLAPLSVEKFLEHRKKMEFELERFVEEVDRAALLAKFWEGSTTEERDRLVWGWKDPRNSATALIWKEIFPQLRVIVVSRDWRRSDKWPVENSQNGKWYRESSTPEIRDLYSNPIGLEHTSVLHVDVDEFTSNAQFFGRALTWCGLDSAPAERFESFLDDVGFER